MVGKVNHWMNAEPLSWASGPAKPGNQPVNRAANTERQ
jgi:hypothetical protein